MLVLCLHAESFVVGRRTHEARAPTHALADCGFHMCAHQRWVHARSLLLVGVNELFLWSRVSSWAYETTGGAKYRRIFSR